MGWGGGGPAMKTMPCICSILIKDVNLFRFLWLCVCSILFCFFVFLGLWFSVAIFCCYILDSTVIFQFVSLENIRSNIKETQSELC